MSSVNPRRATALTTNWVSWTNDGESDHRSATRNSSGIRSNAIMVTVTVTPMAIWITANVAGDAARAPHSHE